MPSTAPVVSAVAGPCGATRCSASDQPGPRGTAAACRFRRVGHVSDVYIYDEQKDCLGRGTFSTVYRATPKRRPLSSPGGGSDEVSDVVIKVIPRKKAHSRVPLATQAAHGSPQVAWRSAADVRGDGTRDINSKNINNNNNSDYTNDSGRGVRDRGNVVEVEREINVLRNLRHSGCSLLTEALKTDDAYVIAMQRKRHSLDARCFLSRFGVPGEARTAVIIFQLLTTLHYLHEECGVVHRDVKLENIVVSPLHVVPADAPRFRQQFPWPPPQCAALLPHHGRRRRRHRRRDDRIRQPIHAGDALSPIAAITATGTTHGVSHRVVETNKHRLRHSRPSTSVSDPGGSSWAGSPLRDSSPLGVRAFDASGEPTRGPQRHLWWNTEDIHPSTSTSSGRYSTCSVEERPPRSAGPGEGARDRPCRGLDGAPEDAAPAGSPNTAPAGAQGAAVLVPCGSRGIWDANDNKPHQCTSGEAEGCAGQTGHAGKRDADSLTPCLCPIDRDAVVCQAPRKTHESHGVRFDDTPLPTTADAAELCVRVTLIDFGLARQTKSVGAKVMERPQGLCGRDRMPTVASRADLAVLDGVAAAQSQRQPLGTHVTPSHPPVPVAAESSRGPVARRASREDFAGGAFSPPPINVSFRCYSMDVLDGEGWVAPSPYSSYGPSIQQLITTPSAAGGEMDVAREVLSPSGAAADAGATTAVAPPARAGGDGCSEVETGAARRQLSLTLSLTPRALGGEAADGAAKPFSALEQGPISPHCSEKNDSLGDGASGIASTTYASSDDDDDGDTAPGVGEHREAPERAAAVGTIRRSQVDAAGSEAHGAPPSSRLIAGALDHHGEHLHWQCGGDTEPMAGHAPPHHLRHHHDFDPHLRQPPPQPQPHPPPPPAAQGLSQLLLLTPCGTDRYLPPEMLRWIVRYGGRKKPTTLAHAQQLDSYAVGVVCYVLLSGYFPFNGKSKATLCQQQLITPKCTSAAWRGVSAVAIDFVQRLLHPDPDRRSTIRDALAHPWMVEACAKARELGLVPSVLPHGDGGDARGCCRPSGSTPVPAAGGVTQDRSHSGCPSTPRTRTMPTTTTIDDTRTAGYRQTEVDGDGVPEASRLSGGGGSVRESLQGDTGGGEGLRAPSAVSQRAGVPAGSGISKSAGRAGGGTYMGALHEDPAGEPPPHRHHCSSTTTNSFSRSNSHNSRCEAGRQASPMRKSSSLDDQLAIDLDDPFDALFSTVLERSRPTCDAEAVPDHSSLWGRWRGDTAVRAPHPPLASLAVDRSSDGEIEAGRQPAPAPSGYSKSSTSPSRW